MNESKISVRYAKALFQAALEEKIADSIMTDLKKVGAVASSPEFREMLSSPVVKTSGKKKVFNELFSAEIKPLSMKFLNMVLDNKRETSLEGIIRYFTRLYKEQKGILSAGLITPMPLSAEFRNKLRELLKKLYQSDIELEERIKPELIGGFILKVEDEQFDASVSTALTRIEKDLLKQANVK